MRKPRMHLTSSPKLLRSGAFASVIGGFLFAVWGYVHKDITPLYLNVIVHVLALIVPVLFMVALATLYPRCTGRAAFHGESGIILGSLGSALGAVRALVDLAVPSLYPHDAQSGRILQLLFDV